MISPTGRVLHATRHIGLSPQADAANAQAAARLAGRSDEAELHTARLADLLDLAAEHDIAVEPQTGTAG